jgi:hypothetical protein
MMTAESYKVAAQIVQDAGGELVGRTRLQKIAYLAQLAGFPLGFEFEYHHYGPYSEDLARGMDIATLVGVVGEEERQADWGGRYSIYRVKVSKNPPDPGRSAFVQRAKIIDANELELAATAAYLFVVEKIGNGKPGNPWHETRRRKPQKSENGRLERAAQAYADLRKLSTPHELPRLPSI